MGEIRVFLVEDNCSTCALVRSFLEELEGVSVCGEAHNGWEALELLHELKPDLMLLDLVMPGMDGLEVLRALEGRAQPKIIVLSGVGSDEYVQRVMRLGASYYMVKPARPDELARQMDILFPPDQPAPDRDAATWGLLRMGADQENCGFQYAVFAAGLIREAAGEIQMKRVYLETAAEFRTNYACVEKNLRTLIRKIHQSGKRFYTETLAFGGWEKPLGNGVFLKRLAETLD